MGTEDGDPEDAPVPPGAVRGRAWHRIAISGVVAVLVAVGVTSAVLALSDPSAAARGTWTAAAALSLSLAAFIVNLLVMHGLGR